MHAAGLKTQEAYMNDKADQRHEINRFTYSGGCEIMYC